PRAGRATGAVAPATGAAARRRLPGRPGPRRERPAYAGTRPQGQAVRRPDLEGESLAPGRAAYVSGMAAAPVCVRGRCRSVAWRRRARTVRPRAADRGAGAD